ncbi:hypothetical protein HK102_002561 [Quaeritorhiza haematococci]|nr:hypothetical protein HK102_002561 [Quaeritorhiza haematococci]
MGSLDSKNGCRLDRSPSFTKFHSDYINPRVIQKPLESDFETPSASRILNALDLSHSDSDEDDVPRRRQRIDPNRLYPTSKPRSLSRGTDRKRQPQHNPSSLSKVVAKESIEMLNEDGNKMCLTSQGNQFVLDGRHGVSLFSDFEQPLTLPKPLPPVPCIGKAAHSKITPKVKKKRKNSTGSLSSIPQSATEHVRTNSCPPVMPPHGMPDRKTNKEERHRTKSECVVGKGTKSSLGGDKKTKGKETRKIFGLGRRISKIVRDKGKEVEQVESWPGLEEARKEIHDTHGTLNGEDEGPSLCKAASGEMTQRTLGQASSHFLTGSETLSRKSTTPWPGEPDMAHEGTSNQQERPADDEKRRGISKTIHRRVLKKIDKIFRKAADINE